MADPGLRKLAVQIADLLPNNYSDAMAVIALLGQLAAFIHAPEPDLRVFTVFEGGLGGVNDLASQSGNRSSAPK